MKRTLLNLIVDLTAALLLLGMIATGYILRFPLPPGTNKSLVLWGLPRHSWGSVHFWISWALLAVLLLHIMLHWQWLVSVVAKRLGRPAPSGSRTVSFGLIATAVLASVALLFGWIVNLSVERIEDGRKFGTCPSTDEEELTPSSNNDCSPGRPRVAFAKNVEPIFARSCLSCHGPEQASGNFRVDRQQDFYDAIDRRPLIVRGDSDKSPLIAITSGEQKDMPLAQRHRLPDADLLVLKAWIDGGAEWSNEE